MIRTVRIKIVIIMNRKITSSNLKCTKSFRISEIYYFPCFSFYQEIF